MIDLFKPLLITGIVNKLEAAKAVATDQDIIKQFTYQQTSDTTMQVNVKLVIPGGYVQVVVEVDIGE